MQRVRFFFLASSWCSVASLCYLLVLTHGGCRRSAPQEAPPSPPPGEVWLTPAQADGMKVQVAPVALQRVGDSLQTVGKIAFDDTRMTQVFSPVGGRVVRLIAQLGEKVKAGAPLAVLAAPEMGVASSDLRKAEADCLAAKNDFLRKGELLAVHAVSTADYEAAEDAYQRAQAELARAQQKVALFRAGSGAVTQTYTIRSPIQGEVLTRTIQVGMELQGQYEGGGGAELFAIGNPDVVWVLAELFEADLGKVQIGTEAKISVVSDPHRVFTGKVDWVSTTLDPVTRTAKVRCTLSNLDRALRPEMYATVSFHGDTRQGLALPRSAVLRLRDTTLVFVETGVQRGKRQFMQRPVVVMEHNAEWVEILQGLSPGESVVTSGGILLSGLL